MARRMRQLKITKQVTNRETPSLDKYLQDIGKVKLITAQEEVELAQRIKQGDMLALEKLASANLRFVVSVAKQYQGKGLTLPDLINEGNLGLMKAVGRFDETRGFKFISYAVWWIRQQILQAIAEQGRVVRLPLNKIGSINKINKAFAKLEQEHHRPPTIEELTEVLEMTHEEVKTSLENNNGRHVSLDAPAQGEESTGRGSLLEVMPSSSKTTYELLDQDERTRLVERILTQVCREQEKTTLFLYYGLGGNQPHTLEEIGQKFDLTRERARQIKERAIRRLKHSGYAKQLRPYLG